MGLNHARADEKREELEDAAAEVLRAGAGAAGETADGEATAAAARELVRRFARITPPEAPELRVDFVVVSRYGEGEARTTKPGNLRLDMKRLVHAAATGVLTAVGAWSVPWTIPLAALVIWNDLHAQATVALSPVEACVIWTMWLHADRDQSVADDRLLALVNEERAKVPEEPIARERLDAALASLARLECIERLRRDRSRWWLREWVSVNYH